MGAKKTDIRPFRTTFSVKKFGPLLCDRWSTGMFCSMRSPNKPKVPPPPRISLNEEIYGHGSFPAEGAKETQAPIKFAQPYLSLDSRVKNFTDMRFFCFRQLLGTQLDKITRKYEYWEALCPPSVYLIRNLCIYLYVVSLVIIWRDCIPPRGKKKFIKKWRPSIVQRTLLYRKCYSARICSILLPP